MVCDPKTHHFHTEGCSGHFLAIDHDGGSSRRRCAKHVDCIGQRQ